MIKNIQLVLVFFFCSYLLIAQEKNKLISAVKSEIQITYSENGSGSLGLIIEPKHTINSNNLLGLRIGGSIGFGRNISSIDESRFKERPDALNISVTAHLTATYEKYFRNEDKSLRPFIGGGIGYYITNKQNFEIFENDIFISERDAKSNGQILFLIRSGFDIGKFRLGLEYNYIPEVNFKTSNGQKIGNSTDSFTALSIGYTTPW